MSPRRYALESLEKFLRADSSVVSTLIEELLIHIEIQQEVLELKKAWNEMVTVSPDVIGALTGGDMEAAGNGIIIIRNTWMPLVDTAIRLVSGLAQKNHFHPRPCWAELRARCEALRMMLETAVGDTDRTKPTKPLNLFESFESWLASEPMDPIEGAWYDRDHLAVLRWLNDEQKKDEAVTASSILRMFFKSGSNPQEVPYRNLDLPGYLHLEGLMRFAPVFNQIRNQFKRGLFASSLGDYPRIDVSTPGPTGEMAPHRVIYRRLWRNLGTLAKLLGSIRHCVPLREGVTVFFRPICDHLLEVKTIVEHPVFSRAFERATGKEEAVAFLIKRGCVYLKELEAQISPVPAK